jgi:adenylylsulfate kinase
MVYWISGASSAGKTVYAKRIKKHLEEFGAKVLLYDGDEVRDVDGNVDYSDESREKHIMTIAKFAAIAERQGFVVIIALVSPLKEWRMKARKLFDKSILIYLPGGILWEGSTYQIPDTEEIMAHG